MAFLRNKLLERFTRSWKPLHFHKFSLKSCIEPRRRPHQTTRTKNYHPLAADKTLAFNKVARHASLDMFSWSRNSQIIMEPAGSLPCSQESAIGPCPGSDDLSTHCYSFFSFQDLILPFLLHLGPPVFSD